MITSSNNPGAARAPFIRRNPVKRLMMMTALLTSPRILALMLASAASILPGCSRAKQQPAPAQQQQQQQQQPSAIEVKTDGNRVVVGTGEAEFEIFPSGYVRGALLQGGAKLSLDEPPAAGSASGD